MFTTTATMLPCGQGLAAACGHLLGAREAKVASGTPTNAPACMPPGSPACLGREASQLLASLGDEVPPLGLGGGGERSPAPPRFPALLSVLS